MKRLSFQEFLDYLLSLPHIVDTRQVKEAIQAVSFDALSASPRSSRPCRPRTMKERKHVRYYLGKDYPGVYVTRRELQCLKLYAADRTIQQVANFLHISYRAAECFIVSLRKKTGCARAVDLLQHPGLVRLMNDPHPKMSLRMNRRRK